ncbi:hypothetical protein CXU19_00120 [Akkermansia muciniphila]|nr:hypothetical protein CXU19_00120 [Akkermansia muciniphila]PNC37524.1 hypothetical protein CXU20_12065 [Akkermansia muciniphila]
MEKPVRPSTAYSSGSGRGRRRSPPEDLFPNEGLNTASPLPGIKNRGNKPPPAKCSRRARTTAAWIFRLYAGAVYK